MIIHVVMAGETVELLARTYSVSVQRIISDNGLIFPYQLTVGQALIITQPSQIHVVQPGETVFSIAVSHDMSVQQLYQNNPELSSDNVLYPGQVLTIAFRGTKQSQSLSVTGYTYPFINDTILRRALPFLTCLNIFSYTFRPDGSIISIDDEALILTARSYQVHPVLVLSSLDETESFSSELVHQLLNSEAAQDALLNNLIPIMVQKGYRGLDIDFEYIPAEDADNFVRFLEKARDRLHLNGMTLSVALAPKNRADQPGILYEGLDYTAIGEIADTSFLMTYDWGYYGGPPMPIAPANEVDQVLAYATTAIPNDKLLMGIPNYGYNWTLPYVPDESETASIGNLEAVQLAVNTGSMIQFDEIAQSPFFLYNQDGEEHVVWFEDVRSLQAKYELQQQHNLLGVGYWNLMRPFPQNWAYLSTNYNITKLL